MVRWAITRRYCIDADLAELVPLVLGRSRARTTFLPLSPLSLQVPTPMWVTADRRHG